MPVATINLLFIYLIMRSHYFLYQEIDKKLLAQTWVQVNTLRYKLQPNRTADSDMVSIDGL